MSFTVPVLKWRQMPFLFIFGCILCYYDDKKGSTLKIQQLCWGHMSSPELIIIIMKHLYSAVESGDAEALAVAQVD